MKAERCDREDRARVDLAAPTDAGRLLRRAGVLRTQALEGREDTLELAKRVKILGPPFAPRGQEYDAESMQRVTLGRWPSLLIVSGVDA